ncbi:MAG: DNA-3-methyladenine glycosylase [Deltaproteobacteria bacterium RBG_13_53_10]|nr:MAG: DNA-3-methyladenine glycosylase [Deltaproteobacteria bacterium RBG_13_53_10]
MIDEKKINRCEWCGTDPLYVKYHDDEWGIPVHDDRHLFEMLILEGAQAGLNWLTILAHPGIVRNRLKIEAAIKNAQGMLDIKEEFGTLDAFLWRYVDHIPKQNARGSLAELPPRTEQSDLMSKDLKNRGFSFVGSTICYSFMQTVGMVNDHVVNYFRHDEIRKMA